MLLSVTAFMYYCSTFCHHSPTVPCRISCLWRQCCFISAPRMVLEEIPQRPLGGELCRWDGLAMMPGDVMDNQFIPFVNTIKIYTLLPCAVLCCCATVCCGASYHTHSHSHTHTSSKSLLLWLCHPHSLAGTVCVQVAPPRPIPATTWWTGSSCALIGSPCCTITTTVRIMTITVAMMTITVTIITRRRKDLLMPRTTGQLHEVI